VVQFIPGHFLVCQLDEVNHIVSVQLLNYRFHQYRPLKLAHLETLSDKNDVLSSVQVECEGKAVGRNYIIEHQQKNGWHRGGWKFNQQLERLQLYSANNLRSAPLHLLLLKYAFEVVALRQKLGSGSKEFQLFAFHIVFVIGMIILNPEAHEVAVTKSAVSSHFNITRVDHLIIGLSVLMLQLNI